VAVKHLPAAEFLSRLDPDFAAAVCDAARRNPAATHMVLLECLMLDSSHRGAQQALAVGPGHTYESPEAVKWLGDLPSRRLHPVACTPAEDLRAIEPGRAPAP
jgi:hypothetical protein